MPPGVPPPTAQRNFTDPDSSIMKDADKAFIQGYNAQAAVNAHAQVIAKVHAEWTLICLTQNLLTLYRSGRRIPA